MFAVEFHPQRFFFLFVAFPFFFCFSLQDKCLSNGLEAEEKSPKKSRQKREKFALIFCTFIKSSRCFVRWSGEYLFLSEFVAHSLLTPQMGFVSLSFRTRAMTNFSMKFHFGQVKEKRFSGDAAKLVSCFPSLSLSLWHRFVYSLITFFPLFFM